MADVDEIGAAFSADTEPKVTSTSVHSVIESFGPKLVGVAAVWHRYARERDAVVRGVADAVHRAERAPCVSRRDPFLLIVQQTEQP